MRYILLFGLIISGFSQKISAEMIMLSIPRSGSHWLLYALQYLTEQPFTNDGMYPVNCDSTIEFANPFRVPIDNSLPPLLIRTHNISFSRSFAHDGHKLIYIMRNPLEVLVSWNKLYSADIGSEKIPEQITQEEIDLYLSYIELYEEWDPDARLLVSYEDLMNSPESTLSKVLAFLDCPSDKLPAFLDNIEHFKHISLTAYSRHFPRYGA